MSTRWIAARRYNSNGAESCTNLLLAVLLAFATMVLVPSGAMRPKPRHLGFPSREVSSQVERPATAAARQSATRQN